MGSAFSAAIDGMKGILGDLVSSVRRPVDGGGPLRASRVDVHLDQLSTRRRACQTNQIV